MNNIRLTTILFALLLAGCGQESNSTAIPGADDTPSHVDSIQWFDGSIDEAFAVAKAEGKPIYLYWGAAWCPPCHAIKSTVFRSAEFIERSRLFIAVYLDGDDENAQAAGEDFGVLGYPTMIVFNPEGNELTRIPGGIDIQAYANILDLTLGDASPVSELIESLESDGADLSADECRLLAYYSWRQNPGLLEGRDEVALYRAVYDACPKNLASERTLLYMRYLDELLDSIDSGEENPSLDQVQVEEATGIVFSILGDPELLRVNVFPVIFDGAKMTSALTRKGSDERREMTAAFAGAMDQLAADERVYKRERIYTVLGKIYLEQIDDSEVALSAELQDEIRAMVIWADESTPDVYERQAVINAASNVLSRAGMPNIAKPLLLAELGKSKQPYYFMLALADIEQEAGNYAEALRWLKQAYEVSTGPATRFQWGYYYLSGLLEMTPQDAELIQSATINVIHELDAGAGFYQRPKAQLGRLEQKLLDWGEETDHSAVLSAIRADVLASCGRVADRQEAIDTCQSFLDSV